MCGGRIKIQKAKSGPKKEYEGQHEVADSRIALLRVDFSDAINQMESELSEAGLKTAIATGKTSAVAKQVKWKGELFASADDNLRGAIRESAENSERFLPTVSADPIYNQKAKPVDAWVNHYAKQRLQQMDSQTRKVVKDVLKQKANEGLTTAQTAKKLRERIGLNSIQAQAMNNLEKGLIKKGKTEKQIEKVKNQYKARAIKHRAKMIANTEAIDAVNFGQLELWQQAREQGLIDNKVARKNWLVTPDDKLCPYCRAMDGQKRKLDEKFVDPSGTFEPVYTPTLHPFCRCSMYLTFT